MAVERITFKPAQRQAIKALIGMDGPTGAGKTLSALRIAEGIRQEMEAMGENPGPITLIDTERGRAKIYAPVPGGSSEPPETYDFMHVDMRAPFSPDRYADHLSAAAALGPSVIIIDQITFEWFGTGGVLEIVDKKQASSRNKWAAWREPKEAHNRFVNGLKASNAHVILCFRAKEKYAQVGSEIVNKGWTPMSEPDLPYEMTLNFLVGVEGKEKGGLSVKGFDYGKLPISALSAVAEGEQASEDVGRRIARWAAGKPIITEEEEEEAPTPIVKKPTRRIRR